MTAPTTARRRLAAQRVHYELTDNGAMQLALFAADVDDAQDLLDHLDLNHLEASR